MPDPNKHAALASAGFRLAMTCETCVHWAPRSDRRGSSWGRCALAEYQHGKHSGVSFAGTPSLGTCDRHGIDLRSLSIAVGDDFAARYLPEGHGA